MSFHIQKLLSNAQSEFYKTLSNTETRDVNKMFPLPDYPIRADNLDKETLELFRDEVLHLQKQIFPDHSVKHLPIFPGGEVVVLNLILSALGNLAELIPDEINEPLNIENEQFRLIFYRKSQLKATLYCDDG